MIEKSKAAAPQASAKPSASKPASKALVVENVEDDVSHVCILFMLGLMDWLVVG